MYWYKNFNKYLLTPLSAVLITSGLYSCRPDVKETGSEKRFFDVSAYFKNEAVRLTKLNPAVTKSASHNNDTQTQKVHIKNWTAELDLFTISDINKPSWRDSYTIANSGDSLIIYKAKLPELKTKEILVRKHSGKVDLVMIYNHTDNLLYQSSEKLTYFPDSLYLIEKRQSVKLLGTNKYKIEGILR
ncbi:hypothetical protein GCM10023149_46600 [Mucilaginibacter gynuensis]|uniref:Lipoprotein n=1 Tax=Mucilaginibacter gynuensis TaxID=1302236 RepID=A0ABP8HC06_9SPHI